MAGFTSEKIVEFKGMAARLLVESQELIEEIQNLPVDALIKAYEANPEPINASYQYITERIRHSDLTDVIGVCFRYQRKIVPIALSYAYLLKHVAAESSFGICSSHCISFDSLFDFVENFLLHGLVGEAGRQRSDGF